MKIKLDWGAYLPERAHDTDAGIDLRSMITMRIEPHSMFVFPTGVHVQLPQGTCGILVSKSGLNAKYGITSTGLIDEGYTGAIMVSLYNNSDTSYWVQEGDKISQLVIVPCLYEDVELVDKLENNTARGSAGFGSTGK